MATDEWGPIQEVRTGVTGGDESKPSGSSAGVDYGVDQGNWDEIIWYLGAATETDVATVQFWYYNEVLDDWHKGVSQDITGSTAALTYTLGGRVDLQLTSITGTFSIHSRPVRKDA